MGSKVNPVNFRLGILTTWKSKWFNKRKYREFLREDVELRAFLKKLLKEAGVDHIDIDRSGEQILVTIHSSRPGVIIGRQGDGIDMLKTKVVKHLKGKTNIKITIEEIRQPELASQLIARNVAEQLEKRVGFRRACKQTIERVMQNGAAGVRVMVSGRLDGSEMSRTEWFADGKIPLQTLRADIDFARDTAHTTYGAIGVKVWVYKGEKFEKAEPAEADATAAGTLARPTRKPGRRTNSRKPA
jgi:small subunit ribosomal protein S3